MPFPSSLAAASLVLLLPLGTPAAAGSPVATSPYPTVAAAPWTVWLPGPGTASTLGTVPGQPQTGSCPPEPFADLPAEPRVAVVAPLALAEDRDSAVLMHPGRLISNERGLPSQTRHLRRAEGGAFIGVGVMPSLLLLAMRERERGILMDYDRDVVRLNRVLLDLVRAISETPQPGGSSELQRYQFISTLCMADVSMEAMEGVADLPGGPEARARALLERIQKAPLLTPGAAPEHLRPVVKALQRIYDQATIRGGPAELKGGLYNMARKDWPGTPAFETFRRDHQRRFAAQVMKEDWTYYFKHLMVAAGEAEHLFPFSDSAWQRLATMHGEGRIQAVQGDLARGDGALAALGRSLKEAGVPVAVLYASNSVQHFGTVPTRLNHFLENLEALPWSDHPVVLLAGTPRLLPAMFTRAMQEVADGGGDVFTYHALRPEEVRAAVW